MVTDRNLAAYDAAPVPSPRPAQLAVYFIEDGSPIEMAGVESLDISIENPTVEHADAPELGLTLLYEPLNPHHRALIEACDNGSTLVVRVATRDESGRAVAFREMECKVVRYRMAMNDRFREDSRYLRVNIDLEATGELTTVS